MRRLGEILVLAWALLLAAGAAHAESRIALVIGNGAYAHTTALANPGNDARQMTEALKSTGFEVIEARDTDRRQLDGALRSFADRLGSADVALFYYAGHGLQVGASNYLVPVDARLERERDLEFEAVKLDFVLRQMEIDREGKTTIVFLDACRDNPLTRNLARSMGTRSTAIGRGLAPASAGLGTFIAYATQPGNVALDGQGGNSPFTAALARHMRVKGRSLPSTMIEVRKDVIAATGGKQVPWDHSAMTGDFYFLPGDAAPAQGSVSQAPAGSAADLKALQERLARLEAEARARESSGASVQRLADLRARAASLDDQVRDLQKRLNARRMDEGKAADAAEKARIQRDVSNIMLEWTRRGQELKKIKDEIAGLDGKSQVAAAPQSGAPPVIPRPKQQKVSPNFETSENVRLSGAVMRSFKAPNPESCLEACEAEATCIGFQHGKKAGNMGQCELFAAIETRHEDLSWRSGVRKAATDDVPVRVSLPENAIVTARGFYAVKGMTVSGEVEKTAQADGIAGCVVVCFNTPGCRGATFLPGNSREACRVLRKVTGFGSDPAATAILHPDIVEK